MMVRIVLFFVFSLAFSVEGPAQNAPLIGIDSNYALDMATRNKAWKDRSVPVDPCELFAKNGCQNARIRLWVGEDGINRLTYATQTCASCAAGRSKTLPSHLSKRRLGGLCKTTSAGYLEETDTREEIGGRGSIHRKRRQPRGQEWR